MFLLKNLNSSELEIVEDKVLQETKGSKEFFDFYQYKSKSFQEIEEPVKWQEENREEWSKYNPHLKQLSTALQNRHLAFASKK